MSNLKNIKLNFRAGICIFIYILHIDGRQSLVGSCIDIWLIPKKKLNQVVEAAILKYKYNNRMQ